jgi:hypothetical protein
MNELEVQEVGYKFFHEYRGRLIRVVYRDGPDTKDLIGFLSHIRHGHIVFQDAEETIPIGRIDAVYNIVNKLIAQAKE